ncbi:MAG TPA: helix-turn-helix transcriptional regulator [Candidatus Saccharimonadales bacterium]
MQDSKYTPPFKTLGTHLKYLREHSSETLAEVSGAVEINEDILERIEQGEERPSEEILMLLISHFNMQDNEAVQLWELAGYDRRTNPDIIGMNIQEEIQAGKPLVMLLAIDVRTQYTDGVEVSINNAGAVMTFTQAGGLGQVQPVARVGMSLQQAEAVSNALQLALMQARYQRPKGLPAPRNSTSQDSSDQK